MKKQEENDWTAYIAIGIILVISVCTAARLATMTGKSMQDVTQKMVYSP